MNTTKTYKLNDLTHNINKVLLLCFYLTSDLKMHQQFGL